MSCQLSIVGVGPQRSGTTWLYECLRHHPQLYLPDGVKETFFFDQRFDRGWQWYWSHFPRPEGRRLVEVAPTYFDVSESADRIHAHNPECRVVVTLRDPAERSFSLYLHHRRKGRLECEFPDAIDRMPRILDSSRYRRHIHRWRERFGPERVHVILLDDIAKDPLAVLRGFYRFADLQEVAPPPGAHQRINAGGVAASRQLARWAWKVAHWLRERRLYQAVGLARQLGFRRVYGSDGARLPELPADERAKLIGLFEEDIAYVEELLGRPLPEWRRVETPA